MIKYSSMRISLIIPTLNAGAHLEDLLSRISTQDVKPVEIIIIDSSSEDDTVEIAKRFGARTMVIPRQAFNHGRARNMAAMEAQGDVFAFMTQDALPLSDSLLDALTAPLLSKEIAASYGRQLPRPDASPLEIFARQFNYPPHPSTKTMDNIVKEGIRRVIFSDVCSAVKREAFLEAGKFPEVRANEDMLIALKLILLGYKVAYVAAAGVLHSHNYSLLRQFRRYYNIGSSLKRNPWVLRFAPAEGEGLRFMRSQLRFILGERRLLWMPYVILEAMAKYTGYRTGLIAG
jgi:rhamnosyltransferase